MSYLNQVQLIGVLGKNPEILKEDKSGCFVRLSLATNKKYTNADGETVQDTQWHTVYLNNGTGKYAASYLKKGGKVLVLGELRKHQWKDKKDQVRTSIAVYAKECRTLTAKLQEKEEDVAVAEEDNSADDEMI
jgi:single-strand DNA-binding protein